MKQPYLKTYLPPWGAARLPAPALRQCSGQASVISSGGRDSGEPRDCWDRVRFPGARTPPTRQIGQTASDPFTLSLNPPSKAELKAKLEQIEAELGRNGKLKPERAP